MDFALVVITIILINTLISLILFNINAEQQSKIFKEQNEFDSKTVELFRNICKEQLELYSKVYDLELKNCIKEMEGKRT